MTYRIEGLSPTDFLSLFSLDDAALAARSIERHPAEDGMPCRITLDEVEAGDEALLLPFAHHAAATPFRASGPIFVSRRATTSRTAPVVYENRIPPSLARRLLSVRAYDARGSMVDAEVCGGSAAERQIETFLAKPEVDFLHVHYARRGCYAARVTRG